MKKRIETVDSTPAAATAVMSESISLDESKRLIELETIINAEQKAFIEVGNALAEIRDTRLYRSDYPSFEKYCQEKWTFTKQHAYRLIKCAPIAESNLQVTSLNQARELAKVPAAKRQAVVKVATAKAKSAGRTVTARDITEAAQPAGTAVIVAADPPATVGALVVVAPSPEPGGEPETTSIGDQLQMLWSKATPAERSSFLKWAQSQPVADADQEEDEVQFKCNSCEATFADDSEGVSLYECNDCGTRFTKDTSANDNHQCPDCSKFGSKVSDCGCPECGDGEMEEIAAAVN